MRFEDGAEFGLLAERTKADYLKHLDAIELEFGTFPIDGLKQRRARVIFSEWKDRLAKKSLRQADYAWTILARCLSWALKRGLVEANPLERGGGFTEQAGQRMSGQKTSKAAYLQWHPHKSDWHSH